MHSWELTQVSLPDSDIHPVILDRQIDFGSWCKHGAGNYRVLKRLNDDRQSQSLLHRHRSMKEIAHGKR
jgi:hypothetical protein